MGLTLIQIIVKGYDGVTELHRHLMTRLLLNRDNLYVNEYLCSFVANVAKK